MIFYSVVCLYVCTLSDKWSLGQVIEESFYVAMYNIMHKKCDNYTRFVDEKQSSNKLQQVEQNIGLFTFSCFLTLIWPETSGLRLPVCYQQSDNAKTHLHREISLRNALFMSITGSLKPDVSGQRGVRKQENVKSPIFNSTYCIGLISGAILTSYP